LLVAIGQGEHLAVKDWGLTAQSDPYLCFRQLRRGARPLDYVETLADRELAEGEWWSQPLFRDSKPARWEGDGGADTRAHNGRASGLFPRWRPVLLKLDRLVENGRIDERFLVECWDRPGRAGHHADEHEQIGFVITSVQEALGRPTLQLRDFKERTDLDRAHMMYFLLHASQYANQTPDTLACVESHWPGVIKITAAQVVESRALLFASQQSRSRQAPQAAGQGDGPTEAARLEEIIASEERQLELLQRQLAEAEHRQANNLVAYTRREAACAALRREIAEQEVKTEKARQMSAVLARWVVFQVEVPGPGKGSGRGAPQAHGVARSAVPVFSGGAAERFARLQAKIKDKEKAKVRRERERRATGVYIESPPESPRPTTVTALKGKMVKEEEPEEELRVRHEDVVQGGEEEADKYKVLDLDKIALMQDGATAARLPAALLDQLVFTTLEIKIQGQLVPVVVYDEDLQFPQRALDRVVRHQGFLMVKEDIFRATREIKNKIDKTKLENYIKLNPPDKRVPWPNRTRYAATVFYVLTLENPLRLGAISAIEWRYWSSGVLALILVNSLMLTMQDPFDDPPSSTLGLFLFYTSNVLSIVFLLEALVRMVAVGLWGHESAFLMDSWNIMDLFIVAAGLLELAGSSSFKFSMLRTLRVLRPLRSVTRIPSLRLVITTIIQAWRPLVMAAVVTVVLTSSLGIIGVAAFQGKLRHRCFGLDTGLLSTRTSRRCSLGANGPTSLLSGYYSCPFDEGCLALGGHMPGDPTNSFDNFFDATLSVFRVMLLDDWSALMSQTIDSVSISSAAYFFVVVMGGPCFATNLFLAVLTQRLKMLSAHETLAVLNYSVRRWCHPLATRAFLKWQKHWQAGQEALETTIYSRLDGTKLDRYDAVLQRMGFKTGVLIGRQHAKAFNCWKGHYKAGVAARQMEKELEAKFARFQQQLEQEALAAGGGHDDQRRGDSLVVACQLQVSLLWFHIKSVAKKVALSNRLEHAVIQAVVISTVVQAMEHDPDSTPGRGWASGKDYLYFHAMLDMIGLVFTYLFVAEFALKCSVLGVRLYLNETGNLVDLAVVLTGMLETPAVLEGVACKLYAPHDALKEHCIDTGGSGLGLLRCFRLLKLGKLLNKFPGISFQLKGILRSMADSYTVLFLLSIATFVFAILGVNIFGASVSVTNLRSPFAIALMRPGMRVFVEGAIEYQASYRATAAAAAVSEEQQRRRLPAVIANISRSAHPVRPLLIQPVNGFTYASTPTSFQPFWSPAPTMSLSRSSDPSVVLVPPDQGVTLTAVIPRFNADTFWDGLLMAFQVGPVLETLTRSPRP